MVSLILGAVPMASSQSFINLSSRISISNTVSLSTSPFSISSSPLSQTLPLVYCGRGDRKTAKGKRFNHSFGNARPRNKKKGRGPPRLPVPPSPIKKDKFEDNDKVKIDIDESLFSS
ncbi:30S ribosomal protein S31 protein [Thalictrum thalictroides]|uniref:30S ribosomal protein S31 protein n=1 Tax=Thalictrum thalictroides TaxID=46969 RepID=A0A7J6W6I3_THATH|nr:30S ribosomal protein S31 protein [Thalictrum thalictroides]